MPLPRSSAHNKLLSLAGQLQLLAQEVNDLDQDALSRAFQSAFCPDMVDQVTEAVGERVDKRLSDMEEKVDKIYAALFEGNGRPSFKEQIALILQRVHVLEKALLLVFGTVLTGVVGILIGILTHAIKLP